VMPALTVLVAGVVNSVTGDKANGVHCFTAPALVVTPISQASLSPGSSTSTM
jgi:hypothetical protein